MDYDSQMQLYDKLIEIKKEIRKNIKQETALLNEFMIKREQQILDEIYKLEEERRAYVEQNANR